MKTYTKAIFKSELKAFTLYLIIILITLGTQESFRSAEYRKSVQRYAELVVKDQIANKTMGTNQTSATLSVPMLTISGSEQYAPQFYVYDTPKAPEPLFERQLFGAVFLYILVGLFRLLFTLRGIRKEQKHDTQNA